MQVNYLIAGIYGEEAGRHIFENMCALLILNQEKISPLESASVQNNDDQFLLLESNENFESMRPTLNGKVYHIQVRKGDGGLDILVEKDESWSVYQCKFFVEGKITEYKKKNNPNEKEYNRSERIRQIENSFEKAVQTAKNENKKLDKWTLCIPKDLNGLERRWLDDFKIANKSNCANIDFIGNLDLSNWLLQNPDIYEHFFYRILDENTEDLRIEVLLAIREYQHEVRKQLHFANDPTHSEATHLLCPSNLNEFLAHIRGFRGNYEGVLEEFREIEELSKKLKLDYKEYKKLKRDLGSESVWNLVDQINEDSRRINDKVKADKINNYNESLASH